MHEAFWNGLFDTRWEDAPLGPEAIRLVLRMRDCGYAERTRRECGHAVVHLGRVLHAEMGSADRVLNEEINRWLGRQLDKAGIETPRRGAHALRHSLAVHLLRSGETLKAIGDVLGHRSPETTFIYTKLHVDELRTVALEPEAVS